MLQTDTQGNRKGMGMLKLWSIEIDRILQYSNLIYFRSFQRHKWEFLSKLQQHGGHANLRR